MRQFPNAMTSVARAVGPMGTLSGSQVFGAMAASASGVATWITAARLLAPEELGLASRLVTLGTLISGLVAAGLGQYLLAALPQVDPAIRSRVAGTTALAASALSLCCAAGVGMVVHGSLSEAALLALIATAVTVANLQDAVYLAANSARDVVLKGVVLALVRPTSVLLVLALSGSPNHASMALAIAVPQLLAAAAWQITRQTRVLAVALAWGPGSPRSHRELLGVGYAAALASALYTWGFPAFATNTLAAGVSGAFYVAWTCASFLGSLSTATANVVVSRTQIAGALMRARGVVIAQTGVSVIVALLIWLGAPMLLGVFGRHYQSDLTRSMLTYLLMGQLVSGIAVVVLGFHRRRLQTRVLLPLMTLWSITGLGVALAGVTAGHLDVAPAYALGASAALVTVLVPTVKWRQQRRLVAA